jgi:hypothetical protein
MEIKYILDELKVPKEAQLKIGPCDQSYCFFWEEELIWEVEEDSDGFSWIKDLYERRYVDERQLTLPGF